MARGIWRGAGPCGYRSPVGRSTVEGLPESLKGWEGHWVAVQDGEVAAAAYSPRELVTKRHEMGPTVAKAVARYVLSPSDDIVIGVGNQPVRRFPYREEGKTRRYSGQRSTSS